MDYQNVFQRHELKYFLQNDEYEELKSKILEHMHADKYGETSIQSLYYDTIDNRLIRYSIEKPLFKEKIRVRSYGIAKPDGNVFLELKRKAYKIVYKRRIALPLNKVAPFFNFEIDLDANQIEKEITYFRNNYKTLRPAMMIIYDRQALFEDGTDLRITFDRNIRYRTDDLALDKHLNGTKILKEGEVLMEIKSGTAFPLWLTNLLTNYKVYKKSFSKYGTAYSRIIKEKMEKGESVL